MTMGISSSAASCPSGSASTLDGFETLWHLHPEAYHIIMMFGRPVATPRWQQAYGADYLLHRADQPGTAPARGVPSRSSPGAGRSSTTSSTGCCSTGMTGELGHYIGPHNDSTTRMVVGAPIVTISLGEERIFRLSHPKTKPEARLPGTGRDGVHHALRDEPGVEARRPSFRPLAWPPHFDHHPGVRGLPELPFRRPTMSDNSKIEWTDATWNPGPGLHEDQPGLQALLRRDVRRAVPGRAGPSLRAGLRPAACAREARRAAALDAGRG